MRLRYWAAARAAAGVAEEDCPADTLAAAIRIAAERHGEGLARVLEHSSFVVDGDPVGHRDPGQVALAESATVEVLPPFAGGAADTEPVDEPGLARAESGGAPVASLPGHPFAAGVGAALVALAAAGASYGGRPFLAGVVFVVQVLLTLAWFAVLDTPGSLGGFVICLASGAAADLLLVSGSGLSVSRLAGVLGLAFPAGLAAQLLRRRRTRVAESLAGTVSGVLLGLSAASLIALRGGRSGREAVVSALIGAGSALLVARLVDVGLARPPVVFGCTRGWPGVLIGMLAAAGAGYAYGGYAPAVSATTGLALAAATAALALAADLAVDLGRGALAGVGYERQLAALTPLTALLPLAVACPAAYLAGRVILG